MCHGTASARHPAVTRTASVMEFASFYGNGAVAPQLPRRHAPAGHKGRRGVIAAGAGRGIAVVVGVAIVSIAVSIVRVGIGVIRIAISAIGAAPIAAVRIGIAPAPAPAKEGKVVKAVEAIKAVKAAKPIEAAKPMIKAAKAIEAASVIEVAHCRAPAGKNAAIDAGPQIFNESILVLAVFLPALVMSKIEARPFSEYRLPVSEAYGKRFWQGVPFGIAMMSLLLLFIAAFQGYSLAGISSSGAQAIKYAILYAIGFLDPGRCSRGQRQLP